MKVNDYKELIVWKKSIDITLDIYELTKNFPSEEKFNLVSQMRRSAISTSSNIAEGSKRGTRKDYVNFLRIAYGSTAELETQLYISLKLDFIDQNSFIRINDLIIEVQKMLSTMISKLSVNNYNL